MIIIIHFRKNQTSFYFQFSLPMFQFPAQFLKINLKGLLDPSTTLEIFEIIISLRTLTHVMIKYFQVYNFLFIFLREGLQEKNQTDLNFTGGFLFLHNNIFFCL